MNAVKCKWVVENFTDSQDYRDLIKAVKDSGRECFAIGKNNNFDFDPKGFSENDCVIVQGSIQMTKNIRGRLPKGCFPVAYNSFDNYLCSAYYPKLKNLLFNDKHEFTTLKNLKENKFDFYFKYGKEAMIFVRPDSGEKTFSGQLIDMIDFDRIWNNAVASNAKDDDIVIVSTPKNIVGEWRFVCSKYNKGEIIAQSTYQYQGKKTLIPSAPFGATELVHEVLDAGYFPDSVFCVDIAQDSAGDFWLLELTSFSSAGLYLTDKQKVVTRVSEIAEYEYLNNLDKQPINNVVEAVEPSFKRLNTVYGLGPLRAEPNKIINKDIARDGGTVRLQTDSGDFYIDRRIGTKTRDAVYYVHGGRIIFLAEDSTKVVMKLFENYEVPEA